MRAHVAAASVAIAAIATSGGLLWREGERARHLAVPVVKDPSLPPPAPALLADAPACRIRPWGASIHAPGRVASLLAASDGSLWIGTFDAGVFRAHRGGAELRAVRGVQGRQLFTNDIAEHEGRIWAATQGGILLLSAGGELVEVKEPGTATTALALAGGRLLAGTSRGLLRLSAGGVAERVDVRGPAGSPLRVSALAASGQTLWIGSAEGAYSLPMAALERAQASGPLVARWHPLVFGSPPARTNVVTALVPFGEGVVAGTDDGGLVLLSDQLSDVSVQAVSFSDDRANEVNPGAAAQLGAAAVFGTQGGGILVATRSAVGKLDVSRPRDWPAPQISALRASAGGLLAATADGEVLVVDCAPELARAR